MKKIIFILLGIAFFASCEMIYPEDDINDGLKSTELDTTQTDSTGFYIPGAFPTFDDTIITIYL